MNEIKYIQGVIVQSVDQGKGKWAIQCKRNDESTFWIQFDSEPFTRQDGTVEHKGFSPKTTAVGYTIKHYAEQLERKSKHGETLYKACGAPMKSERTYTPTDTNSDVKKDDPPDMKTRCLDLGESITLTKVAVDALIALGVDYKDKDKFMLEVEDMKILLFRTSVNDMKNTDLMIENYYE